MGDEGEKMETMRWTPPGDHKGLQIGPHPKAPDMIAVWCTYNGEILDTCPRLALTMDEAKWLAGALAEAQP
jgi:hypothetical protein